MTSRVLVAVVAIPAALGLVWIGGVPLTALVTTIAVLGVREFFGLASKLGHRPLRRTGIFFAGAIPITMYLGGTGSEVAEFLSNLGPSALAMAVIGLLVIALTRRSVADGPTASIAVTCLGVLYAGLLPAFLLEIRHAHWPGGSWAGTAVVFFPLVVTWVCDTAAMFGGKLIGGAKLAPNISPGKTQSGALAGLLGGGSVGLVFAIAVFPRIGIEVSILAAIGMAVALATIGQIGDLVESLFKREAGVKDSSDLIPGHGGILDRFDSLYFVLPTAVVLYRVIGLI